MAIRNTLKRMAAGFLTLALVAGVVPVNVGGFLTESTVIVAKAKVCDVTDVLTADTIENNATIISTNNTFKQWNLELSGSTYAGKTESYQDAIKMRTTSGHQDVGIVTTSSSGKAKKIKVVWNKNTAATSVRKLDIYGKNEKYESSADLNTNSKRGNLIKSIEYNPSNTTTEFEISNDYNDYKYIGLRSNNNALFFDSIEITWKIDVATDISQGTVNLSEDNMVTSITVGDNTITDLSGFDITYGTSDDSHTSTTVPTEPGTYYAYVTPKSTNSDYTGTAKSSAFVIAPQKPNISQASITFDKISVVYTGKEITPVLTVKYDDVTLINGVDYLIADGSTTSAVDKGNYTVIINGINDYTGTTNAVWQIVEPKTYTIGVTNGHISNTNESSADFTEKAVVTVVGNTATGYWQDDANNIVSLDQHYTFYAMFNTNLTWIDSKSNIESIANINISERVYNNATDKYTVKVTSTWDIPKGATVIEAGTLRTATTDVITEDQLKNTTYLKKSSLKTTKGTFYFNVNLSSATANKTIYAMTYVKYSYHDQEYTLYSNMATSEPKN